MTDLKDVIKWLGGNDVGMSSKAIAMHMTTGNCEGSYPYDPSDLGRCLRLLELFPEWKPRVKEMAVYGDVWARMAERWDEMADKMADEVGINWEKAKRAPETYDLMKEIRGL